MNIGFVSDVVYPFIKGGAEKRIYEMGKRLAADDEIHIFGVKWWQGANDIDQEGMHVHGICKPLHLYAGRRRSVREATRFAANLDKLSAYDIDIIDCSQFPYLHCFPSKLISRIKDIPLVITWHEFWGDYWYQYLGTPGYFGKLIERVTLQLADQLIAVSAATKEILNRYKKDAALVPNGVDIAFIDSVASAEISIDALFVGRLISEKNVDLVIRALPAHSTLCIVGDGPEKERLVRLSREVNARVCFASGLSYEQLVSIMKASNALVLPSVREGFGIVALEALACGTPVITTNAWQNAAKELINHGENGFLVSAVVDDIASALSEVDKQRMSDAAKATAAAFDWNILSVELRTVYDSLAQ
ncbi:MAG TPA: glycosyltransferase family 4 protein [Candidatus Acidoferrales bacterium]|jgi:glycosyltransferase involved in cell wall biosynthesis|nr:glycosyltransferase family 4 protein [Candidatus Acidoferrales bacterium]